MALRGSMAALIARVRGMIADSLPLGSGQVFTDLNIQDVLDDTRVEVRYGVLRAEPTLSTGGILAWNDFYSDLTDWEDDPLTQLFGPSFNLLTPSTSDTLVGHWQFNTASPGQPRPVFIKGFTYDRWLAASELLTRWAAALAGSYDVTVGGQSLRRSQMGAAKLELARQYRARARAKTVPMEQIDVETGVPWPIANIDAMGWYS